MRASPGLDWHTRWWEGQPGGLPTKCLVGSMLCGAGRGGRSKAGSSEQGVQESSRRGWLWWRLWWLLRCGATEAPENMGTRTLRCCTVRRPGAK